MSCPCHLSSFNNTKNILRGVKIIKLLITLFYTYFSYFLIPEVWLRDQVSHNLTFRNTKLWKTDKYSFKYACRYTAYSIATFLLKKAEIRTMKFIYFCTLSCAKCEIPTWIIGCWSHWEPCWQPILPLNPTAATSSWEGTHSLQHMYPEVMHGLSVVLSLLHL